MSALRSIKPFVAPGRAAHASSRRACVRVNAAMKLYSNPASRGRIIEWYLMELGKGPADCEVINFNMKEREHKSEEFLKVNPFGKLPALEDGDFKLFESGAIMLYMAEKYGEFKTPQERALANQWALFANSTMTNAVFVEQWRERSMPDVFGTLDSVLAKSTFISGDRFTVSDVIVGAYLLYIPAFLPQVDLSPYPNVLAYMNRMAERPACAATVASRAVEKKAEMAAAAAATAAA